MKLNDQIMSNRAYRMFCELDYEYQRKCQKTLFDLVSIGAARPGEINDIVEFYYKEFTRPPEGWFCWWE